MNTDYCPFCAVLDQMRADDRHVPEHPAMIFDSQLIIREDAIAGSVYDVTVAADKRRLGDYIASLTDLVSDAICAMWESGVDPHGVFGVVHEASMSRDCAPDVEGELRRQGWSPDE